MTSTQPPLTIGWNADDAVRVRARKRLDHDLRGPPGDPSQTALLPRYDDAPNRLVVLHRSPRVCKCDPPARAFAAPLHRPCRRRAASGAEWNGDPTQTIATPLAHLGPRSLARETSLREEQIEHGILTLPPRDLQLRVSSAASIPRALATPVADASRCRRRGVVLGRRCPTSSPRSGRHTRARVCAAT